MKILRSYSYSLKTDIQFGAKIIWKSGSKPVLSDVQVRPVQLLYANTTIAVSAIEELGVSG